MTRRPAAAATPVLHVAEVFGPTVQGEGPYLGRRAVFVRLGGCNLTCAACDTPYTWDGQRFDLRAEITAMPLDAVTGRVVDLDGGSTPAVLAMVVVTGGEPLIHQSKPGLRELVAALTAAGRDVQFETNGTVVAHRVLADNPRVEFVVSPKVSGPLATDRPDRRLRPEALHTFAELARRGTAWFKLVVATGADVRAAARFCNRYAIPVERTYLMPAGTTPAAVLAAGQAIADPAIAAGFNLTSRLHVLLWPTEDRGR